MMTVTEHLDTHSDERRPVITAIHQLILKNDPSVEVVVGSMMGKEMLLYNDRGFFKYGLAGTKDYMSLHVMPIYLNLPLHAKYVALLPKAKFQKGCINFKTGADISLDVVTGLISDCAPIDLIAIRQQQLNARKKKKA
jgi:hypothetical protein